MCENKENNEKRTKEKSKPGINFLNFFVIESATAGPSATVARDTRKSYKFFRRSTLLDVLKI